MYMGSVELVNRKMAEAEGIGKDTASWSVEPRSDDVDDHVVVRGRRGRDISRFGDRGMVQFLIGDSGGW